MPIKHKKQFANNCPLREGLSTHQVKFIRGFDGEKKRRSGKAGIEKASRPSPYVLRITELNCRRFDGGGKSRFDEKRVSASIERGGGFFDPVVHLIQG